MRGKHFLWLLSLLLFWFPSPTNAQIGSLASTVEDLSETDGEAPICCFDTILLRCVDSCNDLPNCYCSPSLCGFCQTGRLVAEGILGPGSGGCSCPSYPFSLDNTCDPRWIGLELGENGLNLESYRGRRVRVTGRPGVCPCALCGAQKGALAMPSPLDNFVCISVQTVEEIAECSRP